MADRRPFDAASEQALLAQCRRQDFTAFGRLVDAYQSRIFGFVKRMLRNDDEALDVTQEVFIKAYQGMAKFDGAASLRTWLFRIAYNLCVDRTRKTKRALLESPIDQALEDEEPREFADNRWNPENLVMSDELAEVIEAALGSMSEKLKTVLLLHDKEDMGYEEIAATVSVPVGTVKSRLFLARAHLQKHVGGYLGTRETG